jgi:hypothetical protein
MNIDSSQGLEVSNIIFRNGLEPEKGATSMMDSINLETPEFVITVHRSGQVTAVVTAESGWEPEDITLTLSPVGVTRIV